MLLYSSTSAAFCLDLWEVILQAFFSWSGLIRVLWDGCLSYKPLQRAVFWLVLCRLTLASFTQAPSSPSSPIANEPKYEKRWLDTLSVPLSMARISRYKAGTERLRYVTDVRSGEKLMNLALQGKAVNSSLWERLANPSFCQIPSTASVSDSTVGMRGHFLWSITFEKVSKAKRKGIQKQLEWLIFILFYFL